MDIAALVNPVTEALPRRSSSGSHSMLARSPSLASANLPSTPQPTHSKPMSRKRKRHDPKPIWAAREDEVVDGQTLQKYINQRQREQPRPQPQVQPPPAPSRNGHAPPQPLSAPQPPPSGALVGYERPISNDYRVYDEITRQVCQFLYEHIFQDQLVRTAIAESPNTNIEVEARWGHLIDRVTGQRHVGWHQTECVIRPERAAAHTKFESTMNLSQHKRMNAYLNEQVARSQPERGFNRPLIKYQHTRQTDQFFALDQERLNRLPPATRQIVASERARVRVTHDTVTGEPRGALIKHKLANLAISSPQTEWDYRIGINLEIAVPGPLDGLKEVVEKGKTTEAMKRRKDRMSYSFLDAIQIDLTQVTSDGQQNHELELELDSNVLLENGDRVNAGQPNQFESLIYGMINNLRVLSREITPTKPDA